MILHPGDMYLHGGTQVHPGSLKFWKSAFKLGVLIASAHLGTKNKNKTISKSIAVVTLKINVYNVNKYTLYFCGFLSIKTIVNQALFSCTKSFFLVFKKFTQKN